MVMQHEDDKIEWVLDREPVTTQEWVDVMGDLPDERLFGHDASKPIVHVTAYEADEFACRAGGRLPTDEELAIAYGARSVERQSPAEWEWTSTADGSGRVARGGCWGSGNADALSASVRYTFTPEIRYNVLGLRCARPLKGSEPHTIPDEEPHWPAKAVDPYAVHRAQLRARGIEATSGCYGERLYHVKGVGISAEKPTLTIYVDNGDWGYGDWIGEVWRV